MKNKQFLVLMLLATLCSSAVPVSAIDVTGSTSSGVDSQFTDAKTGSSFGNILVSIPTNLDLTWSDDTQSFHTTSQVSAKGDMNGDYSNLRISVEDITYTSTNDKVDGNIYFGDDISKIYTLYTADELVASKSVADERQLDIDVDGYQIQDFGNYHTNVIFNFNIGDIHSNPSPATYFIVQTYSGVATINAMSTEGKAFTGTLVVPDSLLGVSSEHYAFSGQSFNGCQAKKVIFPKKITQGVSTANMLAGASGVEEVVLPESGLTSIDSYAFAGCSKLKQVIIPTGVVSIAGGAFVSDPALEVIYLPDTVTSIANGAIDAVNLKEFTIPKSMTAFDTAVFSRTCAHYLKEFNIPSTLQTLKVSYSLDSLTKLSIPDGCTVQGNTMSVDTIEIGADCDLTQGRLCGNSITVGAGTKLSTSSLTFKDIESTIKLDKGVVFDSKALSKAHTIHLSQNSDGDTVFEFDGTKAELQSTGLYNINYGSTWICSDGSVVPSEDFN